MVARETTAGETRVALVPELVRKLTALGSEVSVQPGAGSPASFDDAQYAQATAAFFLDELLRCGTTTAMVYCTVHPESIDAFFTESAARNMRMVAGKIMMDRNCPEFLRDTAENSARISEALMNKWHKHGRQLYAITPRFAATSCALVRPVGLPRRPTRGLDLLSTALAERGGFEPPVRYKRTPDFESGTFNRSATSPGISGAAGCE